MADSVPSEGGVAFTTYLAMADRRNSYVADLTHSSCRWLTRNPHDLATFRYCGEAAFGGPLLRTPRAYPSFTFVREIDDPGEVPDEQASMDCLRTCRRERYCGA